MRDELTQEIAVTIAKVLGTYVRKSKLGRVGKERASALVVREEFW